MSGVSDDVLAERLDGLRAASAAHEARDAERHAEVMDTIRVLTSAGEDRGNRVLDAMSAQSRLVIQAAGIIVALLIVGLLAVVGVNVGVSVPGVGSVGIEEAVASP